MTIKQHGGIFGRNPTFNNLTVEGTFQTSGPTTSSGDLTINEGNLVIGTSGNGIDFSATAGTGTSELFDDYEEGTWTPVYSTSGVDFGAITYSSGTEGKYTKVGNIVTCDFEIRTDSLTVGSASGLVGIRGLPYTSVSDGGGVVHQAIQGFAGDVPSSLYASGDIAFLTYRTAANGVTTSLAVSDLQSGASANANFIKGTFTYRAA